jgi:hypothetical protein
VALFTAVACAAAPPLAAAEEPVSAPASPSHSSLAAAAPVESARPDSTLTTPATGVSAESKPAPTDEHAPREITYRPSSSGLVIEIEGVQLLPRAVAFRLADGSYGVKVDVEVRSGDGTAHHLLTPANGALSFYSRVFDKSGKLAVERGDERKGQEALLLVPGMKTVLSRQWPIGAQSGELWWGRTIELEVGLWGLGRIEADRRPVNRLFVIHMKVGPRPAPKILPPQAY